MIPVNEPLISKNALTYVTDCISSGWISSAGRYIDKFETAFAEYLGVNHAITTTSGTTALHLAMIALEIGKGDEVIIPALTMIAVPFSVIYTGATCIPIDVDPDIYNISPEKIESFIEKHCTCDRKTGQLVNKNSKGIVKAIIAVHLYGHPCDMAPILRLAERYNLYVIEDAAEAHGAEYYHDFAGKSGDTYSNSFKSGTMGDVGCFSFYANKIITTGEGGMVVTNHDSIAERARRLKDLSHHPEKRFLHTEIGYNYRMTNMQAAIGLAQLEDVQKYIEIKRKMARTYNALLQDIPGITLPKEMGWAKNVYWMYAVLIEKDFNLSRNDFMGRLKEQGIDTRTFFAPIDEQPVFSSNKFYQAGDYPVSRELSLKGLYLPSGLAITNQQIDIVCSAIRKMHVQK